MVGPGVLGKDRSWALVTLSCLGVKDPFLAGSFLLRGIQSRFDESKSVPVVQQPVGTSFGSVPVLQQPVGTSFGSVLVLQQPVGTSFGSVPVTNVQKQGGSGSSSPKGDGSHTK